MRKTIAAATLVLAILSGCATIPSGRLVSVPGGSYRSISAAELSEMLKTKDFFFVNVKVPYSGEISQTDAFISYKDTTARLGEYPRDHQAKIVLYCLSGRTSDIAARDLVLAGYTNVLVLEGGMNAWKKAGYQLIDRTATE